MNKIVFAPVNRHGQVDPDRLPPLDDMTILCLQAGEVNTGEFDPFDVIIPRAKAAGAWVHVDAAFGMWARASSHAELTKGIEGADSWTTDAHKWLNTPYDCAMAICRDSEALAAAMNSDAVYSRVRFFWASLAPLKYTASLFIAAASASLSRQIAIAQS